MKDILVNYPARLLPRRANILLLQTYGFFLYVFGNNLAFRRAVLINPKLKKYELQFWNGDTWLMINHVRINRYLKGIDAAGLRLLKRYNVDNLKVNIDSLVDVGSNVGELSHFFARRGTLVLCFEPDPNLSEILKSNLKDFNNVHISTDALGNFNGQAALMIASETADTSLLLDDRILTKALVNVARYEDHSFKEFVRGNSILKMDAEGFEPEVLEGFGSELSKFAFIAIDCGLERNGESTESEVSKMLRERGHFKIAISQALIVNAVQE